jgi:hypothetical protein
MDPIIITKSALTAVLSLKRTLDTQKLKRQVKDIEDSVAKLGTTLERSLEIDLRTAYDHLAAAQVAANDDLRRAELDNARASFARLIHRPETRPVNTGSGQLTHEQLVALGHQGNFYYFLLYDDERQALEQAYICATKFPLLAIEMFPAGIFSHDYSADLRAIAERASESRNAALAQHKAAMAEHRQERRDYLKEMAWRLPLAGGAILVGLVGSVGAPQLAGRGVVHAAEIVSAAGIPPGRPKLKIVDLTEPEAAALMSRISREATECRAALEH